MAVMSRIVENPARGLPFKLEQGGDDKDDFIYNKDSAQRHLSRRPSPKS